MPLEQKPHCLKEELPNGSPFMLRARAAVLRPFLRGGHIASAHPVAQMYWRPALGLSLSVSWIERSGRSLRGFLAVTTTGLPPVSKRQLSGHTNRLLVSVFSFHSCMHLNEPLCQSPQDHTMNSSFACFQSTLRNCHTSTYSGIEKVHHYMRDYFSSCLGTAQLLKWPNEPL